MFVERLQWKKHLFKQKGLWQLANTGQIRGPLTFPGLCVCSEMYGRAGAEWDSLFTEKKTCYLNSSASHHEGCSPENHSLDLSHTHTHTHTHTTWGVRSGMGHWLGFHPHQQESLFPARTEDHYPGLEASVAGTITALMIGPRRRNVWHQQNSLCLWTWWARVHAQSWVWENADNSALSLGCLSWWKSMDSRCVDLLTPLPCYNNQE